MNTIDIALTILSALGALCAIAFGYLAFSDRRKSLTKEESKTITEMATNISWMKDTLGEMKASTEEQAKTIDGLKSKVAVLDDRVNALYRRKGM